MFSRIGKYPAVGLFSLNHIFSMIACFSLVVVAIVLTRKMTKSQYFKMLKVVTYILTCMELFKILWSLINGYTEINSWMPLYFCSLFLYSLWFAISKNEKVKKFGLSYITFAGVVAGAIFIIFPTSSFNSYPIFHFQCIYSMIFHSVMIYCGIMVYVSKSVSVDSKLVKNYWIYCISFMLIAFVFNVNFDANLMFISNAGRIPLQFLKEIHKFSTSLYTIIVVLAHLAIAPVVYGIYHLVCKFFKIESKISEIELDLEEEEYEHKLN